MLRKALTSALSQRERGFSKFSSSGKAVSAASFSGRRRRTWSRSRRPTSFGSWSRGRETGAGAGAPSPRWRWQWISNPEEVSLGRIRRGPNRPGSRRSGGRRCETLRC